MNIWLEAARFAVDIQRVMTLRTMLIVAGGPPAVTEASRMVSEKAAAFAEAQGLFVAALVTGASVSTAAGKAYKPYRRAVRANSRRLGG